MEEHQQPAVPLPLERQLEERGSARDTNLPDVVDDPPLARFLSTHEGSFEKEPTGFLGVNCCSLANDFLD